MCESLGAPLGFSTKSQIGNICVHLKKIIFVKGLVSQKCISEFFRVRTFILGLLLTSYILLIMARVGGRPASWVYSAHC